MQSIIIIIINMKNIVYSWQMLGCPPGPLEAFKLWGGVLRVKNNIWAIPRLSRYICSIFPSFIAPPFYYLND